MLFITFEGPEGSGKTTQINKLAFYLRKKGFKVIKTREPGGSPIAEKVRRILLDPKNKKLDVKSELFLYLASRSQHVKDVVRPALNSGKIVLCDRFYDSTLAYQGYARGLNKQLINKMNRFATENLKPHLTIYLDIDVRIGLKRASSFKGGKDRLEREKTGFHVKVRKGYLDIAKKDPKRIKVIPVSNGIENIFCKIKNYVDSKLKQIC